MVLKVILMPFYFGSAMIQVPGIPPNVAPSGISGGGGSVGDLSVIWQVN